MVPNESWFAVTTQVVALNRTCTIVAPFPFAQVQVGLACVVRNNLCLSDFRFRVSLVNSMEAKGSRVLNVAGPMGDGLIERTRIVDSQWLDIVIERENGLSLQEVIDQYANQINLSDTIRLAAHADKTRHEAGLGPSYKLADCIEIDTHCGPRLSHEGPPVIARVRFIAPLAEKRPAPKHKTLLAEFAENIDFGSVNDGFIEVDENGETALESKIESVLIMGSGGRDPHESPTGRDKPFRPDHPKIAPETFMGMLERLHETQQALAEAVERNSDVIAKKITPIRSEIAKLTADLLATSQAVESMRDSWHENRLDTEKNTEHVEDLERGMERIREELVTLSSRLDTVADETTNAGDIFGGGRTITAGS